MVRQRILMWTTGGLLEIGQIDSTYKYGMSGDIR